MNNQSMKAGSPRHRAIARASSFSFLMTALKRLNAKAVLIAMGALVLTSCATHTVKSTSYTPIQRASENVAEEFLLDIGVAIFDPGLDGLTRREEETTNAQIRVAESRYVPYMLAETLQRSGNWGIVRVLPNDQSPIDVVLNGTVLHSDGEAMTLRVNVSDSSGRAWYTKDYDEVVSRFSYEPSERQKNDPFQVIYNAIANDLLVYLERNLAPAEITEIRTISELRFARSFAPDAFSDYLTQNRSGQYEISALPAENDPLLYRVRSIRERDFMYIDTVQDYYATYAREMRIPYDSWREQSYDATMTLRELQGSARRRFIAGTAVLLGGIAAAANGQDYVTQTGGAIGAGAGAYVIKSGFDKLAEAKMHLESLQELGESLENEVAPRVIDLEDRTITLTGTVEEQYAQWREILADIYAAETGQL
ncbi:MAG: hypothetical protein O3B02_05150 [Proteobacteria bacterium]|nr:hypothetical protein [Pseudomonadota bacterium]MDA0896976.1 hypothetical protein [Pseudomonadota bacterium]MDA1244371.1 hypothetical protein [Pseudomonadota bacterium]